LLSATMGGGTPTVRVGGRVINTMKGELV
jgi:hypothetical protein